MPVTLTELPILSQFLYAVKKATGMPAQPDPPREAQAVSSSDARQEQTPKQLPKGVVLGKDGKPCRSCTSVAAWSAMAKAQNSPSFRSAAFSTSAMPQTALASADQLPDDCPPDVERLGRSTWTMLHSLTANYPERPSPIEQQQTRSFMSLFSNLYPCGHCAEDFRHWMSQPGNTPRVSSRDDFGRWMCEAHNAVNDKLGKAKFDCNKWEERWRTGPPDGHCG